MPRLPPTLCFLLRFASADKTADKTAGRKVRAPFYFPSIDWVFLSLSEVSRNSMMASATFLLVEFSMTLRSGKHLIPLQKVSHSFV
jgi:hypothetical protein